MRSHRVTRWGVLAIVSSLVFAACSGAGGGGGASGSGGTLRIGYDFASQFTNTFDPAKSSGNCDSIVTDPDLRHAHSLERRWSARTGPRDELVDRRQHHHHAPSRRE